MFIIGLTGKAGSGKDTAARALVEQRNFRRYGFADALKLGLAAMFGWDPEQLQNNNPWREEPVHLAGSILPSPREMLQTLGTEWGRETVHPQIWIAALWSRIIESEHKLIVISDVRFDNEANFVKSRGGRVIEVVRAGNAEIAAAGHKSEAGVSPMYINKTITVGDGQLEELQRQVINYVDAVSVV